jgi:subtilisin family serine protease
MKARANGDSIMAKMMLKESMNGEIPPEIVARARDRLRALRELMESPQPRPRSKDFPRWLSAFSYAASAALLCLVAFALWLGLGGGKPVLAFADVIRQIRQFRPYACTMTIQEEKKSDYSMRVMQRSLSSRREIRPDGRILIFDLSQKPVRILALEPAKKTATEVTLSNAGPIEDFDLLGILGRIKDGTEKDLGVKEVEGRTAHGFRAVHNESNDFTVWADPKTGLPIRIELRQPTSARTIVMSGFDFNVSFDESLFSTTAPKEYTVRKVEEDGFNPSKQQSTSGPHATAAKDGPKGAKPSAIRATGRPNDPLFDLQYQFEKMDVLQAWKITRGSPDCLIGVVELGFDPEHPDYRDNLLYPFRAAGMEHPDTWIQKTHGTSVIGLIGAKADNGIGVAGLAPNCHVVPAALGTHKSFGSPKTADQWNKLIGEKAGEAICYLVDKGCKVINCSFTISTTPQSAFEYAIKHDVVVVVASGNWNDEHLPVPVGSLDMLCVGGVDKDDRRWVDAPIELHGRTITQGSSYGKRLNVVAPMRNLVVCMPRDKEAHWKDGEWTEVNFGKAMPGYLREKGGGTSYAAPMASALAGLIRSLRPDLDHKTVIRIIEQGADDIDPPGWDKHTGYGRINFYKSLKLARDWPKK